MCIGVPMQIESGEALQATAVARDADGTVGRETLDMMLVGAQPPGTWVLAFHGAARRVLDPLEAQQILDALKALAVALHADSRPGQQRAFDALFADLVDRTPQLPEHLRPN
jgi:hydrogenase expression/formation protein HypC